MTEKMLPREKLLACGPRELETAELIAILLRTGSVGHGVLEVADEMLRCYDGSLISMSQATVDELSSRVKGLGRVKSIEILAALELGRRRQDEHLDPVKINNSQDGYDFLAPKIAMLDHEEVWIVILDGCNQVKTAVRVSEGGWTQSPVDMRKLLREILVRQGVGFIMAHNHPAGTCTPSKADIELTRNVNSAAQMVGLRMRDHIIVARGNGFYSFMDNGQL